MLNDGFGTKSLSFDTKVLFKRQSLFINLTLYLHFIKNKKPIHYEQKFTNLFSCSFE